MSMRLFASCNCVVPMALKKSPTPPKVAVPKLKTGTRRPEAPSCLYSIVASSGLALGRLTRKRRSWSTRYSRPTYKQRTPDTIVQCRLNPLVADAGPLQGRLWSLEPGRCYEELTAVGSAE